MICLASGNPTPSLSAVTRLKTLTQIMMLMEEIPKKEEDEVVGESLVMKPMRLELLKLIKDAQQKHGLRHNDYQRYRSYCGRRIARLRKALNFVQIEKKKFVKKDVDGESLKVSEKFLLIPLMDAERAWSYGLQLKFEMQSEPRKKYHMIGRLRKAVEHANFLKELGKESCDARSKLEIEAYSALLSGTLYFETNEEESRIYKKKVEEIVPNLRFCAYNIGDDSARKDILSMPRAGRELDELIHQTLQSSKLIDIEWKGRKMTIKHEKVRVFFSREQQFKEELSNISSNEEKISAYESLMIDCKDAIQVLKEDLSQDPQFRNRQTTNTGPVSPSHFLYTYLNYIKHTKVIERNIIMINSMKDVIDGKVSQAEGKKPIKPQDLIRMYENILSNLSELPQLAGLEEDSELKTKIESETLFYKGSRCFYIALSFLGAKKWPEAMALFQRSVTYASKAKQLNSSTDEIRKSATDLILSVERKQFVAHANSILDKEKLTESLDSQSLDKTLPLIERLDHYYDDPSLTSGHPNLINFPPEYQSIPCKPLFFDLALDHVTFPSFDSKFGQTGDGSGQKAGWFGGWLGGWGGSKK
ncbi:SRP68 [Lepeophtheirus salmonis]|uniref:Signal recognition particle subunit SRP68 n=1 Tax=Lepeophtheirus salmonis TaxID=72036 RepID=A0A7R8CV73_LEPSM|nr:SRP68 [Lepeophtheirus salmonis]CAF2942737.1 SRP68 [Lepeophtheirus salmonis]